MESIFRVILSNIKNTIGSVCMEYPAPYFKSGTTFDFSTGSQVIGKETLNQWSCGSCGVIEGNNGFAIGIRKVESEDRIKIDFLELQKIGDKWKAPRINPNNYHSIHYQDLQPTTITLEWEQEGNKKVVGSTSI